MKTLQDAKNEVAEKDGYRDFEQVPHHLFEEYFTRAAELYASQFKASEPIEKDFDKGTDIQSIEDYIYDNIEYYRSVVNPGIDEMLVEKIRHKYTIKIIKHHP